MKIAICNETYRDWSFEDAFRHARECGYDGIEFAPFTIERNAFDISEQRCYEISELTKHFDLEVVGLHWLLAFTEGLHLTSPEPATRQRTAEYLAQLAAVCQWLGGAVMVFGSPAQRNMAEGVSVDQANEFALECFRMALPALEQRQVTLALEPLGPEEGNFMTTAEWGRHLVEQLDSPFVRLHLDVKAMSTESDSIPDIIQACESSLCHFHCNDPNRRGPGMGDVDFGPIIGALKEIEYEGWLSVEVFDETVPAETTAMESIRYLRNFL